MSFHHCESVSERRGEAAWPRLCWRYSAISAGSLSDSSPSSSSTWPPGASSSCTLASSGTAAPGAEGAGSLWQLQRWAAGLPHQTLEGTPSRAECLRRHARLAGGMAPPGWRKGARRERRGGETTPATGTVHLKDAMPKTWTMEEVGVTETSYYAVAGILFSVWQRPKFNIEAVLDLLTHLQTHDLAHTGGRYILPWASLTQNFFYEKYQISN